MSGLEGQAAMEDVDINNPSCSSPAAAETMTHTSAATDVTTDGPIDLSVQVDETKGNGISGGTHNIKENVAMSEGVAGTGSDQAVPPQPQIDQPTSLAQAQDDQLPTQHISTENDTSSAPRNHDASHVSENGSKPSNYNNAAVSVLGNTSDKNDFIRSVPSSNNEHNVHVDFQENDGTALKNLKKWFKSSDGEEGNSGEHNSDANDYHNFSSPNPSRTNSADHEISPSKSSKEDIRKLSIDDKNGYENSLIGEGDGDVELRRKNRVDAVASALGSTKPIPGTEEEERVMGQCSFFYDHENPSHERATNARRDETQHTTDEESLGYFAHAYPHARSTRLNPRAMAMAIKTRAKRQWTERRYRRRLRQSQLGVSPRSYNRNGEVGHIQQREEDDFVYELTAEHRQAFLAAHTALNNKLPNEYGRNRHAIRKQFGYEYDIDYDLELGEMEGASDNEEEEIRADLTSRSSLAIRGGLIRMPVDNVRLVCESNLQPGILSIETRDVSGGMMGYENFGNANRYGNIIHGAIPPQQEPQAPNHNLNRSRANSKESMAEQLQKRNELAYVLTVDEHIYQRVVAEIGDSHRTPCGLYYCCHGMTENGDHVGIGVAIGLLLIVFALLVAGMVAWPTW